MTSILYLIICSTFIATHSREMPDDASLHTIIVLVGGTGDLATKYLWQGVFNIYHSHMDKIYTQDPQTIGSVPVITNHTYDFFTAARLGQDDGNAAVNKILRNNVTCEQEAEEDRDLYISLCQKRKQEFIDKVSYAPLQNADDFNFLCSKIITKFSQSLQDTKKEILLYMAISTSAYESVLQNFDKHCHRLRELKVGFKVALEKPFGLDKASAESMSKQILKLFSEDEIYRIDHFLGKPVVKSILPFRYVS